MTIPYRISGIKTTQFAVFPENFTKGEDYSLNSEFNFSVSKELNKIRCISTYNFVQNEIILLKLELQCFFDIAQEGIDEIKKQKAVPKYFLQYMGTIVVGTARGVVHTKTEGSVMNSLILPPINLVEGIKNDLQIEE